MERGDGSMRMYDLIERKKRGQRLEGEEIRQIIEGYCKKEIPDYQMSALLMAIWFNGMDEKELTDLTYAMAESGDTLDLSGIEGKKVDKHSTGGVGDKTTLIVAPIAAACGLKVAKMSGRGLGHTGGTIDKLESIPGYRTTIPREEFIRNVNVSGLSVIGQSGELAPADKLIYALRDATATVDSIPLIASSIMSKKLAAGADCIVLDVKTGSGAFMKTEEEAFELARTMIKIGENAGRKMAALITDMDTPLGRAVGNSLEVIEAVEVLKGEGPQDLLEICLELSAKMLELAGLGDEEECRAKAREAVDSGKAFEKLVEMVSLQGGDTEVIKNTQLFKKAEYVYPVYAGKDGYILKMDAEKIGEAAMMLGAGRKTKEDKIDMSAGIILAGKTGDKVAEGEEIAYMYTNITDPDIVSDAEKCLRSAYIYADEKPEKKPLIYKKI